MHAAEQHDHEPNLGAQVLDRPDQVERLFQPFQRLGGSRVRNAGGHGLGLAIVRAIADAHDAIVTARAREGGGLEIDVTFPAVTQPPPSGSAP